MKRFALRLLSSNFFRVPAAVLLLYTVLGFAALPFAIRWYLPRVSVDRIKSRAEVAKVRINPFLLTLEAANFSLTGPDGVLLAGFDKLHIDFDIGNPFNRTAVVRTFTIDKPTVSIVIEPDGSINPAGLIPAGSEPAGPEGPKSSPPQRRLILDNFALTGGELTVTDKRQSTPATVAFQDLSLELKGISTFQDRNGAYSLSARTRSAETLNWQGEVSLSPFRSSGTFAGGGIYAKTLWEFLRNSLNIDSPPGKMDFSADYRFDSTGPQPLLALENLKFNLSDLSLKIAGSKDFFFELGRLDLDSARFDLASRQLNVGKLLADGGSLRLFIGKDGGINLRQVVQTPPVHKEKDSSPAPAERAAKRHPGLSASEPGSSAEGPPWTVNIEAVDLKNMALAVEDLSRGSPVSAAVSALSALARVEIEAGAEKKVLLRQIGVQLDGVRLGIEDLPEPLLEARRIDLEGGELDLYGRTAAVSLIRLSDGRFDATRDKEGKTGVERLIASGNEKPKPASVGETPWKYLVKAFEIANFHSELGDLAASEKPLYRIVDLNLRVTGIDGKSPMDYDVGFALEQGGKAALKGRVDPSGKSVEAVISVAGLPLTPLQPYLDAYTTSSLQSAILSTEGTFRYGIPGTAARLAYEGSLSLEKVRLNQPGSKEPELGWEAMQIPRLALSIEPNGLQIEEIKLSKPVGQLIIAEDKTVNLAKMLKEQPGRATPDAHPAKDSASPVSGGAQKRDGGAFPFSIGRVLVDRGDIVFADLSLRPKFMTRIHDLKGRIDRLSSESGQASTVRLDGGVDKYGTAKVDGSIVLGDYRRSTEITMVFRNVEMAAITPYSGKFAGRAIKSGKLSMDLKYKIRESKMEGDNRIIVENLLLGEHVDSPDAVNLPLDIAVALLTDSKGRIELGLPVSGDLNDPQFSIAPLIWKAFSGLLTKLVTAPFRALGALFGGGAGQNNIEAVSFAAGGVEISPPEKEKLGKLAAGLEKRPRLVLAVQGRYSPGSDAVELKRASVLKAVLSKLGTGQEAHSQPLDFGDSNTGKALEKMYVERFGSPALDELNRAVRKGEIKPPEASSEGERGKGRKAGVLSRMASAVKLDRIVPSLRSPEERSALSAEMYSRLVDSEPYPEKELIELAETRGRAVAAELQAAGLKDRTRVRTREPQAVGENEEPSARLFLETP